MHEGRDVGRGLPHRLAPVTCHLAPGTGHLAPGAGRLCYFFDKSCTARCSRRTRPLSLAVAASVDRLVAVVLSAVLRAAPLALSAFASSLRIAEMRSADSPPLRSS